MCGIAGVLERRGDTAVRPEALERMGTVLAHRGPDDAGIRIDGAVGLAHRRLSIIDLGGGHQPMASEDGTLHIVFNGEIYNFPELRRTLEGLGHVFRTRSDTEVILAAYRTWELDALRRLNGMFAFALWDAPRRRLVAARDRLGKKPFMYYDSPDRFVFASELKAILSYPGVDRALDEGALDEYLSWLYIPAPRTIFRRIRKLLPGHYLLADAAGIETRPYWRLDFRPSSPPPAEGEALERLETLFRDAVRRRLISDVPLGAFLSGGIDSSAVVGMMAKLTSRPVKTFTIGFEEAEFSEVEDARVVARHFGTDHHETVVRADSISILPDLVWHLDEPFGDSSAIPTYYVSRMTREHVTVALAGDGGDELFAGYTRYLAATRPERAGWIPAAIRRRLLAPLATLLPMETPGRNSLCALGNALPGLPGYGLGIYPYIKQTLYSKEMKRVVASATRPFDPLGEVRERGIEDPLSRLQYLDTVDYLPNDILTKVDRASMAHSLEVRAPLLDYELVEFAATLPSSLKFRGGVSKYLFRQLGRRFLPESVFTKRKQGFAIPKRVWFRADLEAHARDRLLDPRTLGRGYFDPRAVRQMLRGHRDGRRDYSEWIWCLLVLEEWHRIFHDADVRRI